MASNNVLQINSKLTSENKNGIYGCIEKFHPHGIRGWLVNLDQPIGDSKIRIIVDDKFSASGFVDIKREDVARKTGYGEKCGFKLLWDEGLPAPASVDESKQYAVTLEAGGEKYSFANKPHIEGKDLKEILEKSFAANKSVTPAQIKQYMEEKIAEDTRAVVEDNNDEVKVIAYYLPQFHPFVENDEWWGPGFTEWTNVSQGKSYFKGHYQPHIPGELGFYDLRLPEVREAQAKLAKEYGIYGFCYYYYWFKGRRLMERPLQEVFESGKPDFPFCICWANETWSRRWDGSEDQILIKQEHLPETDEEFIYDAIPLFKDPRYIRLNGAPLLIIYNAKLMPELKKTLKRWRQICAENGIEKIHISAAETFGFNKPYENGFDSSVQFPPHGLQAPVINEKIEDLPDDYKGNVYDYWDCVRRDINTEVNYKRFPGIMTSWDNTSRRKKAGNIFLGATPELYGTWLRASVETAKRTLPPGERCVFVNAWNEWAEGTHLEPDRKYGRKWLEATKRALTGSQDWNEILKYAENIDLLQGADKKNVIDDLRMHLERYKIQVAWYEELMGHEGIPKNWAHIKKGIPAILKNEGMQLVSSIVCVEQINNNFNPTHVVVNKLSKMFFVGWSFTQGYALLEGTPTYLILKDIETDEVSYFGYIYNRKIREDVSNSYKNFNKEHTLYSGIRTAFDLKEVENGVYKIALLTAYEKKIALQDINITIEII